jgi:hypothetical protein
VSEHAGSGGATAGTGMLSLLLPPRARMDAPSSALHDLRRVLVRADAETRESGETAQLLRHFDLLPRGMPVAALTRQRDLRDAELGTWLRADPAHVRADMGAGRLLACGDLGLDAAECSALIAPLRPLFGDSGCPISIGHPSRWYLALPRDVRLPAFVPPERALGDDIYAHLPEGDAGRRWRHLLSEAQVILHNHPVNVARAAAGKLTVNSLWFWGAGALPDHVRSAHRSVASGDSLLLALASRAGVATPSPDAALDLATAAGVLLDLRALRSAQSLERNGIQPALQGLRQRTLDALCLDFGDGRVLTYRHAHRWRFWRRGATQWA